MFAHAAPTPPATHSHTHSHPHSQSQVQSHHHSIAPASSSFSTSSTQSRPSRLRGLSFVRKANSSTPQTSTSQALRPSSPSRSPPRLARATSTPEPDTNSTNIRSPPAAPSTFLNSSRGYLSSLSNSYNPPASGSLQGSEADTRNNNNMVRRKKAGSTSQPQPVPDPRYLAQGSSSGQNANVGGEARSPESHGLQGLPIDQMPTIKFIPHHDTRTNKPSLSFTSTSRTLPHEDCVIRVGRYSERDVNTNPPPNVPSSAPVGFKSKVVSRRHCEFWCSNGQWYIKDVQSSSGTFLNHIRLSQASVESRPFPINDGDIVQLGIDFRGGEEQIFRCVKIRIECNRAWQRGLNNFNTATHKQLRALGAGKQDGETISQHSGATECAICLMPVAPCQSLFVAPCSHVWHFKCIRPILNNHKTYPNFICPNCRAVANLEEDVDDPQAVGDWDASPGVHSDPDDVQRADGAGASPEPNELVNVNTVTGISTPPERTESPPNIRDLSIQPRSTAHTDPSSSNATPVTRATTTGSGNTGTPNTQAIDIPRRSEDVRRRADVAPIELPSNTLRPTTPGSGDREGEQQEGPLTPRNDAGPFVFDGSAGRLPRASQEGRVES